MEAITITNARQNMSKLMDEVINNNEIKIITRNNEPAVVMMSLDDYNSLNESNYLLSNPINSGHLRKSLQQANAGDLVYVDIKDL